MERMLSYVRIFPGAEAEFDRLHTAVPKELQDEIRASGVRNMTGFRRGTDVWWYAEAQPDRASTLAQLDAKEAVAAWDRQFASIIAERTDADGRPLLYEQIFHTDGGARQGPMSRGLFSLVVASEGIPFYDQLHAEPWPDMIDALAAAGYSDYSGFRRGNHVVYFGEYFPDIETVSARIGITEVNARWGKAFEGVITRITTPDGKLITAEEIYHQD